MSLKPDFRSGAVFRNAITCPMARLVDNVTIGYKTDGRMYVSVMVDGVRHRYSHGKCGIFLIMKIID
jgi:hypothetical protein